MNFLDKIADRLWRFFSSFKLAIWLFITLAVSTMAGSIVLQRPIAQPGQLERAYSPEALRWLDAFGLLDVFHSWWFVLQLALLALNLTVVSIEMWPKFRKRIRDFSPVLEESAEGSAGGGLPELHARLAEIVARRFRRPRVTERGGKVYLGAQSGKYAHLGVYVIHAGIVLILIGGMITGLKGFEGMIQLVPGETSSFYFDRQVQGRRVPLGFEIRCVDTWMEKYPDGSPKSYFSDLEILDGGKVVARKTIKVNDPLSHKGIYFYQATFGQGTADEKVSIAIDVVDPKTKKVAPLVVGFNEPKPLPNGKGSLTVVDYAENIPLDLEGHVRNLGEAVRLQVSESGEPFKTVWLFKNYPDFDRDMRKGATHLVFKDFSHDFKTVNVTGLQVARNPGINVTWTGSALLMAGLLATFLIPHRKLWIVVKEGEILVAAASHRHPETFGRKIRKIIREIEMGRPHHDTVAA
jgi:cytochrome c biogenesis protein